MFTPTGNLQIDDSFLNYRFLGKETIIVPHYLDGGSGFDDVNAGKVISDYFTPGDLLAFRREDVYILPESGIRAGIAADTGVVPGSSGKAAIDFRAETWNPSHAGESGPIPSVTVYRFGLSAGEEKGKHFEVYDSSGKLVFSDGRNYMRVMQGISGLDPAFPTSRGNWYPPTTFTSLYHPVSAKVAMAIIPTAFMFQMNALDSWTTTHGFAFYEDRVEVRYLYQYSWWPEGIQESNFYSQRYYHSIMIDVTGL